MPGMERDVPVLGVASIADRNRWNSSGDQPIDERRREENRGEPDPSDLPADDERYRNGDEQEQAPQPLIEVLLEEKRAVAAERAALDGSPRRRDRQLDLERTAAARARASSRFGRRVIAP